MISIGIHIISLLGQIGAAVFHGHDVLSILSGVSDLVSHVLNSSALGFAVQTNDCDPCPASAFTSTGAAWANIGYYTQSDLLHWLVNSDFGKWAPLLYVLSAMAGLIGVAINMPPRNYMWFFIGPAIYAWLIESQQEVKGVRWEVAGVDQDQSIVWRDAEVGLANTNITKRLGLEIKRDQAPGQNIKVATPFLWADELLSSQVQWLIAWTGLYNQTGDGGSDTNLIQRNESTGPWYIMSNLKWEMLENVTAAAVRNPNIRDAFITFLSSECGDKFREVIDTGAYTAVSQSHGAKLVWSIFKDDNGNSAPTDFSDNPRQSYVYQKQELEKTWIPTPRSVLRMFEAGTGDGSFGSFARPFQDRTPQQNGRQHTISCSEYLWTIIQALRWEAGHSYFQLMRATPNGLNREEFIKTLFYGWDIRRAENGNMPATDEMHAFLKHLILIHLVRNEMGLAPAITDIKYAPSDQSKNYSDTMARTIASKNKFAEIYQWSRLVPHIQGILLYLLIVAYPFAALLMIVPGWHKSMFTWLSFFAWVKLWDLGFAMTQVLERSVWAMIGNNSYFSQVARIIVNMDSLGNIGVNCPGTAQGNTDELGTLCAVPQVCSVQSVGQLCNTNGGDVQTWDHALGQLDLSLVLGSGLDLDLSNAYYVFIMAALYFAVPAVTGQLVLGARAGASGMVNNMIGGVAGETSKAAGTGYSGVAASVAQTNSASVGQAAQMRAMRRSGLAAQGYQAGNQAMDAELAANVLDRERSALGEAASAANASANSFGISAGLVRGVARLGGSLIPGAGAGTGGGTGAGMLPWAGRLLGGAGDLALTRAQSALQQQGIAMGVNSSALGMDRSWQALGYGQSAGALRAMGGRIQAQAQFDADSEAWEARNAFSIHASAGASIAGLFAGALNPGGKPGGLDGWAMTGQLGAGAHSAATYAGTGFLGSVSNAEAGGRGAWGSRYIYNNWRGASSPSNRMGPGGTWHPLGAVNHTGQEVTTDMMDAFQRAGIR